mmetsp:Transcript_36281/g.104381  ORF Transcript_36281/g.104381 Transcript_36281/m.104381 type:complete len:442 (+) Transcript_36281:87-1412(+)
MEDGGSGRGPSLRGLRVFPRQECGRDDEARLSAKIATGKMLALLMSREKGECTMSKSVYDAAIVMPQICRSADNPMSLVHLSIRSYVFLAMNFFLQCFILYMICQEGLVMDKFAGKMHLCDFGASIQDCPDGPNCIGPSGSNYQNAGRMYSYDAWSTRTFARDALAQLFPDKAAEIKDKVDPGEYGLENYWVRPVCVFIFMMSVMSDLRSTIDLVYILWCIPTKAEMWLEYRVPKWVDKTDVKEIAGKSELDFVKFMLAGMPLPWKVANWLLIVIPKLLIWRSTATGGVSFLMETSGIEDCIVNVTALTFILNLDEMIFDLFSHKAVQHILENIESLEIEEIKDNHTAEEACDLVDMDKRHSFFDCRFFPSRPVVTLVITVAFIAQYYFQFCRKSSTGGWVSIPMGLPKDEMYPILTFIFPFMHPQERGHTYWEMPGGYES